MLRKWGTLVLLLLATPLLVMAQSTGKLAGRVFDASTGEPLPGANVLLDGTQMGTITDVDGNYFIIGVPVGTYNVQASFVGYQAQTVENVEINAGYTRELDFTLSPGVELDEIVVEYERPLIQKDAIGAPKVVTAEQIENLPVRGVVSVAALQGGVVNNAGSEDLFIRGGREQQVSYYVDGVKVYGGINSIGVPQQAVQEQEMLIGAIPARYGDAMSGIISITTKGGQTRFTGSAEAITSEVLDGYGYNLGSFTLGGPVIPQKLSFFVSAQGTLQSDRNPFAIKTPRLPDAEYERLIAAPQVLQLRDANGNINYAPLPRNISPGTAEQIIEQLDMSQLMFDSPFDASTAQLVTGVPLSRPNLYTADAFEMSRSKPAEDQQLDFTGNLTFTPVQSVSLRLGGSFALNKWDTYDYINSLYARDHFFKNEDRNVRAYVTWRQYFSNSTFFQIQADYTNDKFWTWSNQFSKNVEDTYWYGDIDHPANSILAGYRQLQATTDENGVTTYSYVRRSNITDGAGSAGAVEPGTFYLPGRIADDYEKGNRDQYRISASATTQIGLNQIEFGGEFETRTIRYFRNASPIGLARYMPDDNVEAGTPYERYDQLPYLAFEPRAVWYGYDFRGINEVNEHNIDLFARGSSNPDSAWVYNVAPYKPVYFAGYLSDKIEYRDLVISLGVRVDVFDNNTEVLFDPYSIEPIIRAGDLSGVTVPSNIGNDYAVYFSGESVRGYRDLDGNFYDANGQETKFEALEALGATPRRIPGENAFSSKIFKDYEPQVTFMPRIGVSFPVTDQALFFASYNVTSQRPSEAGYQPFYSFQAVSSQNILSNPSLKPEKTTQYELGFRQSLGSRAALQISGFYRRQDNLIQIKNVPELFPAGLQTYGNDDFAVTKGAEIEFDLRRTNNVSLNANYTLSFAQGTGSDANSNRVIAWRSSLGGYAPNFITPTVFDRRHVFNITLDYRLGENEGPMIFGAYPLSNFGVNVVANLGSGMPYTKLQQGTAFRIVEDFTAPVRGGINQARLPWMNLVNLRIDRRFQISGDASLTAFLWVQNLFNTRNTLGVYRASGLPDNDGYLATEEGRRLVNGAAEALGDPRAGDAYAFNYQAYANAPVGLGGYHYSGGLRYSLPRQTRLGVRLTF